jgi:hypothetical protein
MTDCVYLKPDPSSPPLRDCYVHGKCEPDGPDHDHTLEHSCNCCKERLLLDHPNFASRFIDHLNVQDRIKKPTDSLRNLLNGRSAFLVCGGPSASENPLEELNQRGVFSLAVNNMAGFHRFQPSAFVCSDPPDKFHSGIWMDPCIMKFVPTPKLQPRRGRLREKTEEGFQHLKEDGKHVNACDAPNVWGFERRAWLRPDESFFTEPSASWGNHNKGMKATGEPKTVCTMLIGLRLLYYLGCRRIFLVGVDFRMEADRELLENYAFDEKRDSNAVRSNNQQYRVVREWLKKMEDGGIFRTFGLEVYNTFRRSGLKAFPFVPFETALIDVKKQMPDEPFDLNGWYHKGD